MQPAAKGIVLIIDDEEGIRSVLEAILGSIEIETLTAYDSKSALEVLTSHRDDIVACMLDMNLEDCFGEELYDKLREVSPTLAVFAMSGIYGEEIKERLGSREIAGLISKPFSAASLIETVQKGLESRE